MLLRLSTIALVLALAAPATAQDTRVWNFDDNPEAPTLGFGAPDSDDVVIAFSCEPSARRMTIVEAVASTKLNPGASVPLKLSAGSVSLALTGDAIASETDGTVNIEVSGPPNPRVLRPAQSRTDAHHRGAGRERDDPAQRSGAACRGVREDVPGAALCVMRGHSPRRRATSRASMKKTLRWIAGSSPAMTKI